MGPRIREDNGDGRFANRPYGLLTTRASAAWGQSIFIAITGEGAHEGRPYGGWGRFVSGRADVGRAGEGWVPACARTTEGEGMTGEGWVTSSSARGQALRGNNGRGRGGHCGMTGDTGTGGSRTALREKERVRGGDSSNHASLRGRGTPTGAEEWEEMGMGSRGPSWRGQALRGNNGRGEVFVFTVRNGRVNGDGRFANRAYGLSNRRGLQQHGGNLFS